jgi:hypothetical protein
LFPSARIAAATASKVVQRLGGLLAGLLAERGDLDGLRVRADVGDPFAAAQLPKLLTKTAA